MTISRELWRSYIRIFFVELAYWVISIGMVFVNQYVLNDKLLTDDLTVFITIFQVSFSLSILVTLDHLAKNCLNLHPIIDCKADNNFGENKEESVTISVNTKLLTYDAESTSHENSEKTVKIEQHRKEIDKNFSSSEQDLGGLTQLLIVNIPERINLETCKVVFPLSILYIGMLLLNNFCLKHVGVAFYFVSRSLTTVFNVIFTYFLINEPVSRGALVCCGFIVLGFILGIDQESVIGSLSVIGVIFGVASSLFTSLFSIYTKKTLAKLDRNIWTLVLYNNINAIALCTPLLYVHGDIQALLSDRIVSPTFWLLLSVSGVMAFFISIVTNASIKYTSPLTHNISGTTKACLQTVIAVIYYHEDKSSLWWLSNVTILVASAFYSRIRQKEMERRALVKANTANRRLSLDLNIPMSSNPATTNLASKLHVSEAERERKHSSDSGDSDALNTNNESELTNTVVHFSRNV